MLTKVWDKGDIYKAQYEGAQLATCSRTIAAPAYSWSGLTNHLLAPGLQMHVHVSNMLD